MKLIIKYLKPYLLAVLIVVGLTIAQVQTELALPNYMSDIVSNGIQYGGITEDIPLAISFDDMNKVLSFVDNKKEVLDNYDLYSANTNYKVKNQEVCFRQDVYVLKDEHIDLTNILQKPLIYTYLASSQGLDVNNLDVSIFDDYLSGLQDNLSSVAKLYIKDLYTNVGISAVTVQNNYILKNGIKMLEISFIGILVQLASTYIATKLSTSVAAKMRKDIFEKVESFSSYEFSKFSSSSLITRTTNDITKVQTLIQMMLRMMLMSPIMGITAIFKVMKYPQISWILLVAVGIMIGVMIILMVVAFPKFEVFQKLTDKLNTVVRESLDGMLVVRAFNSEAKEEKKFDDINTELRNTDWYISKFMALIGPTMTIILNLLTVFITWFSAQYIDIDAMSIGDMMAFIQYAMHVVMSFMFVSMMFIMIPRSLVSAKRINEIFEVKNSINDPVNPIKMPNNNGELKFENVYFRYPGAEEYVVSDISFTASPKETVAFIGSTGSGKSTIVKLIPRLFDVSEGKISYCGNDIRDYLQEDLHDIIGFASQKATLFKGSIKSNIEFGRELNDEQINTAIDVSQSRNIINEKEEGLDSLITQGGTNVSGGQKQRLSIARSLAKNANIYIFDDCFSALDYETDKKLRSELTELIEKKNSTVLIVAQRISTIKNADKIIVWDEGKIVGEGKHQDLLKNCDVYKQIASSQLSKEELEYAA